MTSATLAGYQVKPKDHSSHMRYLLFILDENCGLHSLEKTSSLCDRSDKVFFSKLWSLEPTIFILYEQSAFFFESCDI